jgi:hypothetical protein
VIKHEKLPIVDNEQLAGIPRYAKWPTGGTSYDVRVEELRARVDYVRRLTGIQIHH